jgi:hypothetical protein
MGRVSTSTKKIFCGSFTPNVLSKAMIEMEAKKTINFFIDADLCTRET